jgi:hypothetical protein
VKVRWAVTLIILSLAGCASQPLHSKAVSAPPLQTDEHSATPSRVRVTLPYTFTRHGVEIRVNSIEFAGSQVLVNVTLQETRGETVDLVASPLMQALHSTGEALPYLQYSRAEQVLTDPAIHLNANEQFSVTLYYQPAPGSSDTSESSLELRFPTGKYWSSQADE